MALPCLTAVILLLHTTVASIYSLTQVHYGNRWTDNRRKYSVPNGSGESYDVFFPVSPEIFAAANWVRSS